MSDAGKYTKYTIEFPRVLRGLIEKNPLTGKKTTQTALANYLGVTPQAVSLYCNEKGYPEWSQVLKIADFFGVTVEYLMTGNTPENKNIRDTLKLSESAIENLEAVASGEYKGLLFYVDKLLSDKEFYSQFSKAIATFEDISSVAYDIRDIPSDDRARHIVEKIIDYGEYLAATSITQFFMKFLKTQNIVRPIIRPVEEC